MRYLHTMLRVRNLDVALKFYSDALGLKEVRRTESEKGRFTLVFLCAAEDEGLFKAAPQNQKASSGGSLTANSGAFRIAAAEASESRQSHGSRRQIGNNCPPSSSPSNGRRPESSARSRR